RNAGQSPERPQPEPERDAEQEAEDAERTEQCTLRADEDERERHREPDPTDHPRREVGDEVAEVPADLPAVRVAEDELHDPSADERKDACRSADEREAHPTGVDHVLTRLAWIDPAPRERRRRD